MPGMAAPLNHVSFLHTHDPELIWPFVGAAQSPECLQTTGFLFFSFPLNTPPLPLSPSPFLYKLLNFLCAWAMVQATVMDTTCVSISMSWGLGLTFHARIMTQTLRPHVVFHALCSPHFVYNAPMCQLVSEPRKENKRFVLLGLMNGWNTCKIEALSYHEIFLYNLYTYKEDLGWARSLFHRNLNDQVDSQAKIKKVDYWLIYL